MLKTTTLLKYRNVLYKGSSHPDEASPGEKKLSHKLFVQALINYEIPPQNNKRKTEFRWVTNMSSSALMTNPV